MTTRSALGALAFLATLPPSALAEPRNTVWLEDVHVQPRLTTEAAIFYEFQGTDFKALEEGVDLLAFRLPAGLGHGLELSPLVRFRERGDEAFRLHELGGELRWRFLGDAAAPRLVVYGGYFNEQSADHDHRISAGLAGRYDFGRIFVAGDVRASTVIGGDREDGGEMWVGGAAGYALLPGGQLVAGLETFVIRPFGGERISDPAFGEAARSQSLYYGPTLTVRVGPLWTGVSAATGFMVSEPASQLLVRWMVGVTR
jgi:hypothetical protein